MLACHEKPSIEGLSLGVITNPFKTKEVVEKLLREIPWPADELCFDHVLDCMPACRAAQGNVETLLLALLRQHTGRESRDSKFEVNCCGCHGCEVVV